MQKEKKFEMKSKLKMKEKDKKLPLSDKYLAQIAARLYERVKKEERNKKYAPVKEVLTLLGQGVLLATVFMVPGVGRGLKHLTYGKKDQDAWKHFNPCYLKRTIKNLEKQKQVEIVEEEGQSIVKMTHKGKLRILKYSLDELTIKKPTVWDGKWRLVVYDVPKKYKEAAVIFRESLKRIGFYPFQESVYIYPYPCGEIVEYLRQLLEIDEFVRILLVDKFENDSAFRTYFSLD